MERVMTPEERIRRAEEIYYRRKAQGIRVSTASVNIRQKNKVSLGKKMIIQIVVCVIIYSFFAIIKNAESNFSKTTIQQVNGILNYDINLADIYNQCSTYVINTYNNMINSSKNKKEEKQDIQNSEQNVDNAVENLPNSNENIENTEQNVENLNQNIEIPNNEQTENPDTGESNNNTENSNVEVQLDENQQINSQMQENIPQESNNQTQENIPQESKSQMQLDVEYVISNCSMIVPVNGYITSGFGDREPTEIISAFHQGVDIAAVIRNTNKSSHGRNRGCFFICRRLSETT